MALVVEDGSGLATAESYVSVADADAHHLSRGTAEASWVGLDEDVKEQCLRRATDYMLETYRGAWKGVAVKPDTQALDWPRYGVFPDERHMYAISSTAVPPEVKRACAELAVRANAGTLTDDVEPTGAVLSETVGPIAVTYANAATSQTRYTSVDRMLGPLLEDGAGETQGTARLG
jgi:hypothetical protein